MQPGQLIFSSFNEEDEEALSFWDNDRMNLF